MKLPVLKLLAFCLVALAFTGCERAPHSSPTALRDTNAYFKAISPEAPRAHDPQALDRISVVREGDTLCRDLPGQFQHRRRERRLFACGEPLEAGREIGRPGVPKAGAPDFMSTFDVKPP